MARSDRRNSSRDSQEEPRRRRDRDEDRPRRRKRSEGSGALPWILGIGGILALSLIVGIVVAFMTRGRNAAQGPIANNEDSAPIKQDGTDMKPVTKAVAPPAVVAVPWRYVPDGVAPKKLTDAVMQFAEEPHVVMDIAFSGPDSAHAAVLYEGEKGKSRAMRPVQIDRFDLTTGQRIGTVTLFRRQSFPIGFHGEPKPMVGGDGGFRIALSPDGNRLAAQTEREAEIAIYDLGGKGLIKKWQSQTFGPHRWHGFPDNDNLLHWNGKELIHWRVVDGTEVRRFKDVKGFPELSPNRKHVAFRSVRGIEIVETATGNPSGLIPNEDEQFYGLMPMTFSRDGKELLVGTVSKLYQEVRSKYAFSPKDQPPDGNDFEVELRKGAMNICRRDLVQNTWIDKTRAPLGPGPARFVEGGFLSQGWCLFQTGKLLPFCRYLPEAPLVVGSRTLDDRLWVAESLAGGKHVFYPRPAIDTAAHEILKQLQTGDLKPAIPSGSGVSIVVHTNTPTYLKNLENAVAVSLAHSGLTYDPKGDLTMTIHTKEIVTGLSVAYVNPGVASENAAHRKIECRAVLTDRAGKTLFFTETVANPPRTLVFEPGGASQALEAEVRAAAVSWAGRLLIPPTAHFLNGQLVDLPLTVPFTKRTPPQGKL